MSNLQFLVIACCYGFSTETIGEIVHSNLVHLRLYKNGTKKHERYQNINDKTICEIVSSCPNLVHLYIGFSSKLQTYR